MIEESEIEHFWTSSYGSISTKIFMETKRVGPQVEILNWGIRLEHLI